ncbi:arsenite methyltransferase-like isoform X2 [Lampetra planeri]
MDGQQIHDSVKDYYGKKLQTSEDLQTDVACTLPAKKPSKMIQDAMALIHPAIMSRYFGCGLVVPECLDGCSVLDLGSGSGRDCFLLGKLVGARGSVTGIDMTTEMIETGNAQVEYHRERFGYSKSNVNFVSGYLEELGEAGLGDNTFDIIVSNCVICLCPDKKLVLKEAHKVLKTGGEMYYSDMYASAVVPSDIKSDPCLWGEGMGGAMFWKDLIGVARALGFSRPYLVTASHITITNADTCKKLGASVNGWRSPALRLGHVPHVQAAIGGDSAWTWRPSHLPGFGPRLWRHAGVRPPAHLSARRARGGGRGVGDRHRHLAPRPALLHGAQ